MEKGMSWHSGFKKQNYQLLAAAFAIVVLGFLLMAGGGSENPAVFEASVFSFWHITLAPVVILSGYTLAVIAIFKAAK